MTMQNSFYENLRRPFVFLKQDYRAFFSMLFFDIALALALAYIIKLFRLFVPSPDSLIQQFGQTGFVVFFLIFLIISLLVMLFMYSFFKYCIIDALNPGNIGKKPDFRGLPGLYKLNAIIFLPPLAVIALFALIFLFTTFVFSSAIGIPLFLTVIAILSLPLLVYIIIMVLISHSYFTGNGSVFKKSFRKMTDVWDYAGMLMPDLLFIVAFFVFLMLGRWVIGAFGMPFINFTIVYQKYRLILGILLFYLAVLCNRINFYTLLHKVES